MKKLLALLLLLLMCVSPALADQSRVIDEADVLTPDEEARLEQAIAQIREQYQFDVVLLTKVSIDNKIARYYAADYYDNNSFGYGDSHDGIILLLVTGGGVGNREYSVVLTGKGRDIFSDEILSKIEDDILPFLKQSNYSVAQRRFIEDVEYELSIQPQQKQIFNLEVDKTAKLLVSVLSGIIHSIAVYCVIGGI